MRKFILLLWLSSIAYCGWAADDILNADHPDSYIVKRGDTLWDIASMFLTDAWRWPEIWEINKNIENPHLIYPGDELVLVFRDGKPRLDLNRGDEARTVRMQPDSQLSADDLRRVRVQPRVRSTALQGAIPAIPLDAISPLLRRARIVDELSLPSAPYILAGQSDRLLFGPGDVFFARGQWDDETTVYGIYRAGNVYVDPETKEILGHEAIETGLARLTSREGDISTFTMVSVAEDVRLGDRLLATEKSRVESTFYPKSPDEKVEGVIMSVIGGVTQVGRNDVVVINRGANNGLDTGHVLSIEKSGKLIKDRFAERGFRRNMAQLPSHRAGIMMVYRVFEKMSYALVLKTSEPLQIGDKVKNP